MIKLPSDRSGHTKKAMIKIMQNTDLLSVIIKDMHTKFKDISFVSSAVGKDTKVKETRIFITIHGDPDFGPLPSQINFVFNCVGKDVFNDTMESQLRVSKRVFCLHTIHKTDHQLTIMHIPST